MNITLSKFLSISLLAIACLGTSADVYKWTDDTGRVHYSDKPDVEENLEIMNVKSKRTDKVALAKAEQIRVDVKAAAAADARLQDVLDQEQQQNADIRAENCARASEALSSLKNAQRLYIPGEDGNRRYLSDEEIADRIQRAETDKARWCEEA